VTSSGALLATTLALPLAMLIACLSRRWRNRMPALLAFAPLPGAAAALNEFGGTTLVLPRALLGLTFVLDRSGAMLLGASALLWIAAGAYSAVYLRDRPDSGRFTVWWLMTLTGSLGIFIAADLMGFYLFFTLVSLAAYGLVVFDGGTDDSILVNTSRAPLIEPDALGGIEVLQFEALAFCNAERIDIFLDAIEDFFSCHGANSLSPSAV
jgi:formate hydrogenlyase subunit 3/multisubunit Na+/H+ antiporter MnhD subunit